jgi:hypothetical protein
MKKLFLILLLCAPLFLAGCSRQPSRYDTFADCLTESGAKMYGTDWCPHCKNQKKLFGSSFDKVDYINCERNQKNARRPALRGIQHGFLRMALAQLEPSNLKPWQTEQIVNYLN